MRLINRSKQSPLGRQACDAALAKHVERYGDYGRNQMKETYTVQIEGVKVWSGGGEQKIELRGHSNDPACADCVPYQGR